jgi:recombination protein RecT
VYFVKHNDQLAAALPKHLNPDRMVRLALTAFSQNSAIGECDPKTTFGAVVTASQLGLEIGIVGQGFLGPYGKKCQFIPGWQGLVDLVSRTGRATAWTGAVFEGDEFEYEMGDKPFVKHKPKGEDNPKKMTHVYAVGRVNGSEWPVIEVWPIARVWKHRDRFNKVGKRHYSYENEEMYARKIPLLQVIKYLPKSIELSHAIGISMAADDGRGATIDGEFLNLGETPPAEAPEKPAAAAGAPTIKDALAHVNKKEYTEARDIVKGAPFSDNDRAEIEAAIKKHQTTGEQV